MQGDEDNDNNMVEKVHIENETVPQLHTYWLTTGEVDERGFQMIDKEFKRRINNLEIALITTGNNMEPRSTVQYIKSIEGGSDSDTNLENDTPKLRRSTRTPGKMKFP